LGDGDGIMHFCLNWWLRQMCTYRLRCH